jgi:inorganic pyrophosphatase
MSYNDIPAGKDLPNDINVIIEIPANHDPIKYEVDKDSDAIFVDRFVATPMFYPANYGYVPQTLSEDGDPLDVLVVAPYPVMPGSVIRSRVVGVLKMSDESGIDAKLLAVPHSKLTKIYDHVEEIEDLDQLLVQQIAHYFDAGQGTLMTFSPDPAKDPANADLVKKFNDAGITPEGYVLYTYAAIQSWAQAASAAGSNDSDSVLDALNSGSFDTVLGSLSFDDKGDVTLPAF